MLAQNNLNKLLGLPPIRNHSVGAQPRELQARFGADVPAQTTEPTCAAPGSMWLDTSELSVGGNVILKQKIASNRQPNDLASNCDKGVWTYRGGTKYDDLLGGMNGTLLTNVFGATLQSVNGGTNNVAVLPAGANASYQLSNIFAGQQGNPGFIPGGTYTISVMYGQPTQLSHTGSVILQKLLFGVPGQTSLYYRRSTMHGPIPLTSPRR